MTDDFISTLSLLVHEVYKQCFNYQMFMYMETEGVMLGSPCSSNRCYSGAKAGGQADTPLGDVPLLKDLCPVTACLLPLMEEVRSSCTDK